MARLSRIWYRLRTAAPHHGTAMETSHGELPEGTRILVKDRDRSSYRSELLPVLNPTDEATLRTFIEYASSDPGLWHRLPESDLAFRVISDDGEHGFFRFEMRDDRFPDEIRSYRHDRRKLVLSYRSELAIEHRDLPGDNWLPRRMSDFALAVAGIITPRLYETQS